MNKIISKISLLAMTITVLALFAIPATAAVLPIVDAGADQYINSNQSITLQGFGHNPDGGNITYFWSCTAGYLSNPYLAQPVYTTPYLYQYNNQTIYTCTLTVSGINNFSASDSMTVFVNYNKNQTSSSNNTLFVSKKAINLSSGNLNWAKYINAIPYDILSFSITIQAANNQTMNNVFVRDILPQNLIYKGNLTVNSSLSYSGNPISGINVGTIPAGNIVIIAYQAQVAGSQSFNYGNTTLTNTATITSNETSSQTDSATVFVNRSGIQGATDINTGVTNDLFADSFFLPLMLIFLTAWLYLSGRVYRFADWLKVKIAK